ncbi:MAG: ABC transporter permease [Betaproteobacteria bacterium]|nr:ABC transporter permease [Betaproteobacteria bacterium]
MLERLLPGFRGLFYKETIRFMKVPIQTLGGPVLASMLFIFVFSHVLGARNVAFADIGYFTFLVPGLAAMTMLQNAFANSSSSMIQSKITGNIVMLLLPPISPLSFFLAYLSAALLRGVIVALLLLAGGALFEVPSLPHPLWALAFLIIGGVATGAMGIITGVYAERFDQIALFQMVVIMPLTFLSGVFYSIHSLPPLWQTITRLNPFTYFIDGFRYGFVGTSDNPILLSLLVTTAMALVLSAIAWKMIASGWKIRS